MWSHSKFRIVFVSVVLFIWESRLTDSTVNSFCLFSYPEELKTNFFFLCGQAYEELFWRHHIKCVRQVKRDNYDALRSVLFQIFSQGLSFPSWMKEKDIVKVCLHTGNVGERRVDKHCSAHGRFRGPLCAS